VNHESQIAGHEAQPLDEVRCVGCGCTDSKPCFDLAGQPCRWVAIESDEIAAGLLPRGQLAGLCSHCAIKPLDQLIEMGMID